MDMIIAMIAGIYMWLSNLAAQIGAWAGSPATHWDFFIIAIMIWGAAKEILQEIGRISDRIEIKLGRMKEDSDRIETKVTHLYN